MSFENLNWLTIAVYIIIFGVPLILAITLHEAGHALAAKKLGDPTADDQGRVTLNPIKHIDPLGTFLLPLILFISKAPFLFGWARPVPVSYNKLRTLPRDIAIVAAAGPFANLILIFISALVFNLGPLLPNALQEPFALMIRFSIQLNTVLICFNLLPIPPLDGSKILMALGPRPLGKFIYEMERFGMFIVLGLLLLMPALTNVLGYNPLFVFFQAAFDLVFQMVEPLMKLHCFNTRSQACGNLL